jgi:hypothetical protein
MEPADLLRYLAETFERLGLTYLVTGSTATVAYGEPRFTNDIDVVVDLPNDQVAPFCAAFPAEQFYVSADAVAEAVRLRHQFNILHPGSGLKVDVIVASSSEFDRARLGRALRLHVLPDRAVAFASPEDVILKKMEYYKEGGSEKHLRDIAGVLRVRGQRLDRAYIEQWAARLGLHEIWDVIRTRSDQSGSS